MAARSRGRGHRPLPLLSDTRPIEWLELALDYRCNNRCVGCFTSAADAPSADAAAPAIATMTSGEAVALLRRARARGATGLWLGGGEPTLRGDLFPLVRAARRLGFTRVKLETNAMLLSYPEFVDRCVDAGVTEVDVAIKGPRAELHDRWTRTPGCFALLLDAIEHARARALPLTGDVLLYASTVASLPETLSVFAARGVERFRLWMLSAEGQDDPQVRAEVPTYEAVVAALAQLDDAPAASASAHDALPPSALDAQGLWLRCGDARVHVTSLHTPPCTLPPRLRGVAFDAAAARLWVANPGGHGFMLEDSAMEGGAYVARCASCALRPRCGGPRADYLEIHGDAALSPLR